MNVRFLLSGVLSLMVLGSAPGATISSFTPVYASTGQEIQIDGSGFGTTNIVRFGSYVSHSTRVGFVGTRIFARVPTNAPVGSNYVLGVSTGSGFSDFAGYPFRKITTGPYVASLNPGSGDANTSVQVVGANLVGTSMQGQIKVWFNGVQGTITGYSDNMLTCTAPNGVTTGPVTVARTTGGGNTPAPTNETSAIFYVTPVVTNFFPSFGRAGTNVVIRGRNFTAVSGVFFNGLSAPILSNTATEVYTEVPAGATTGRIHVQTPASSYFQSTSNFVIQPLITGFTPNKGRPGTNVTITGANLYGATAVHFGGVQAAAPTGVTYNQLTAVVPNNAPTGPITVQTTNGTFVSSQLFYLPPRINSFVPTNAPVGSIVSIAGTNFLDASAVTFNGTPAANFWVTNNGSIAAEVPPGVVSGPISVTTPHSTTNSQGLFYAVPIIAGFNPDHGLPGDNVLMLGTNFSGVTAVKFNGTTAAFTETNGVLRALVPTNAATGPVSITGPAGTTLSGAIFTLDYTSDLAVAITAPASVLLGTDYTYVITVTNRGPFAAPNVLFTNLLPGSVVLKGSSTTHGTLNLGANPITCSIPTLNANSRAIITLTVTPLATGTAANSASAYGGYPDPVSANNVASTNTTIFVTPVVAIQPAGGGQIRISWPVNLSDYVLQSTDNIASSNSWADVATEPEFIGDQKVVTEPIGNGPRFYRLKR